MGNRRNYILSAGMAMFLAVYGTTCAADAASNYSYSQAGGTYNASNLQGQVVYIPAGITAAAILNAPLDSQTVTVGTPVSMTLPNAITYNGKTVAQKGSVISGTVVKCKKAGFGNRNGQIKVIFNNLRTPQGYNIAINAIFKTDDNSGVLKGGTKVDSAKDYGKNTLIGAGSGAALGTAMGALSGGSVGRGAVYGTAVGAGIGVANAARQKGDNVSIPANVMMDIYFTQPITVSAPNVYNY